jgi:hypothetical protein
MKTTSLAPVLLLALAGCAFDDGPARTVPVEVRSQPAAAVTTDLGWTVTVEAARLFVHVVTFVTGEDSAATGETHSHLTSALTDETGPVAVGTIRLAHGDHAAATTTAAGTPVGQLVADRAFDLLASPHDAGSAIFAIGSTAAEAHLLVAPPEAGAAPEMHGAGLYLAGTAVRPGDDPIDFEAALSIGAEAQVTGLGIHADDVSKIEIHVPRDGWFDGIDFEALPGGLIEDGSAAAGTLEERLLHDTFHVHAD